MACVGATGRARPPRPLHASQAGRDPSAISAGVVLDSSKRTGQRLDQIDFERGDRRFRPRGDDAVSSAPSIPALCLRNCPIRAVDRLRTARVTSTCVVPALEICVASLNMSCVRCPCMCGRNAILLPLRTSPRLHERRPRAAESDAYVARTLLVFVEVLTPRIAACPLELRPGCAEGARSRRAAGRVVLRLEIEDDWLSPLNPTVCVCSFLIFQRKRRRSLSRINEGHGVIISPVEAQTLERRIADRPRATWTQS